MPKLKPETLEARRNQILEAALTRFADTGYNLTTMDDIVREAGLSKGSIYTYFNSKKELFLSLLEKMIGDTGLISILSSSRLTGRQKLDSAMAGMIAFTTTKTYQDYAALLMDAWAQSQVDEDVKQTLAAIYSQLRSLFEQLIEQSISSSEFKPVDSTALANVFIALFDGLMVQKKLDQGAVNWQTTAETIQFSWFSGLLVEPHKE
jgi:AcrR family transcriptional regulator